MNKETIFTLLGVLAAVVIAWFAVDVVLSAMWFIAKLVAVAIVAAVVYVALRLFFARGSD